MFFAPKVYHYPFILILLPLSLLYGTAMFLRRTLVKPKDFDVCIISVGNLIVGGSGKTPFVIFLASKFEGAFVISRGYGRESTGLIEVSCEGEVLVDVRKSGDEAMLMAKSLAKTSVIVSEDRHQAINFAKKQGAKLIILDDGFNRIDINKYEILLEPEKINNYLTFPAGGFREFYFTSRYADMLLKGGRDFKREVEIINVSKKMLLVTAISNPQRLDKYLPQGVQGKLYLEDHAYFEKNKLLAEMKKHKATHILCTSKDRVKLDNFAIPLSEMKLKLTVNDDIILQIEAYIKGQYSAK